METTQGTPLEALPAAAKSDILDVMIGPHGPSAFRDFWETRYGSASFTDGYIAEFLFGSPNLHEVVRFVETMLAIPLVEIDLSELDVTNRAASDAVVRSYSQRTTKAPEIIIRRHEGKWVLVEGGHRTKAAIIRGDHTIRAYDVTQLFDLTEEGWCDLDA